MRDLIAYLYIWLAPGVRRTLHRIRARTAPHPLPAMLPVLPTAPTYARRPVPPHVIARRQPLDGHAVALVRPYLRVYEQACAAEELRRIQRERRTAAALATCGIDYDPLLTVSDSQLTRSLIPTPARRVHVSAHA